MKRIIAAALSVLVGAFGYTIVDQAMEDRVTNLESEVVELRGEVSKYHPKNTTSPYEGSEVFTTEAVGYTGAQVGDFLVETENSTRKFLIREYNDGRYVYIPSYNYEPVSFGQKATTAIEATNITGDDVLDGFEMTTTQPYALKEYFLYVTESTAQITAIEDKVSYSYGYDKNYSEVSKPINKIKTFVTVTYKGYTDSSLAGKKIQVETEFTPYDGDYFNCYQERIEGNIIKSDGSFECIIVYSDSYIHYSSIPYYFVIRSLSIK